MRYAIESSASDLFLWTYKDGLLSRVAHDLCLKATEWEAQVERDGERLTVTASIQVAGLKVQGQAKAGVVTPLKPKDHREIESNMTGRKVLDAARFPTIDYSGSGALDGQRLQLEGTLSLHGQRQPLVVDSRVREEDDGLAVDGEVELRQTAFGIKPYSALMGALKVQDSVRVSWSLRLRAL